MVSLSDHGLLELTKGEVAVNYASPRSPWPVSRTPQGRLLKPLELGSSC